MEITFRDDARRLGPVGGGLVPTSMPATMGWVVRSGLRSPPSGLGLVGGRHPRVPGTPHVRDIGRRRGPTKASDTARGLVRGPVACLTRSISLPPGPLEERHH